MIEQILKEFPNANGYMNILKSSQIEIIGEEHNEELTNSSIFHKIKSFLDKKKIAENPPLVLLEHPSVMCKFHNKEEMKHFRKFGRGGINYLFLKLIQSYPSIQCVDTRIQLGYLLSLQENELLSKIEALKTFDKKIIFNCLTTFINLLESYKENEEYYKFNTYIYQIYLKQRNLFEQTLTKYINSIDKNQSITLVKKKLVDLFSKSRNLSSFSVDVHIVFVILNNPNKKIIVFCGNKHLFRLYCLLTNIQNINFTLFNNEGKTVKITKRKKLGKHFTNWQNIDYSL